MLGEGPTLLQVDLLLKDYACSDPISKESHFLKCGRVRTSMETQFSS